MFISLPAASISFPAASVSPASGRFSRILAELSVSPGSSGTGRRYHPGTTRIMATSGARKEAAAAWPSATSPPQQSYHGAPTRSVNPSTPPHFYPGIPTGSSTNPSTPHLVYPHAMDQQRDVESIVLFLLIETQILAFIHPIQYSLLSNADGTPSPGTAFGSC